MPIANDFRCFRFVGSSRHVYRGNLAGKKDKIPRRRKGKPEADEQNGAAGLTAAIIRIALAGILVRCRPVG